MKLHFNKVGLFSLLITLSTICQSFAQATPQLSFRTVTECQNFSGAGQFINLSGSAFISGRSEFISLSGFVNIDGTCSSPRSNTVVNQSSLVQLRDHVASINSNQQNSSSTITELNNKIASLEQEVADLKAFPSNQCIIEIQGECPNRPDLAGRSFLDLSGMRNLDAGFLLSVCRTRAEIFHDRVCGANNDTIVTATHTNTRRITSFPAN